MNINILRYSFFSIAGGQKVDHTFAKFKTLTLLMTTKDFQPSLNAAGMQKSGASLHLQKQPVITCNEQYLSVNVVVIIPESSVRLG